MARWFVHAKKADFKAIASKFGIDQVTARIIRNRGIIGDEEIEKYLNGTLEDLFDPSLLSGTSEAAGLLDAKISEGKRIRVIGDYDIDGVCATFILLDALRKLGASVDYDIPDRINDGYGLHIRLVEAAYDDGIDTILTCDNGISAMEPVSRAKALGMNVIVTDHHQPLFHESESEEDELPVRSYELPEADVLIDPHLPEDLYPYKQICGAVVAFKLMQVLYERKMSGGAKRVLKDYLPYAALATVGDVMDLQNENRIIVKYGLSALQHTENTGMKALIEACGLSGKTLGAYHLGFILGPCINAGGRLESAKIAMKLLLETEREKADEAAGMLVSLNEDRKLMTQQQLDEAIDQFERASWKEDPVYLFYLPNCHESIAGIVAGKLRERLYHPVFVLTDAKEEGLIKGSGRSVPAWNMYEALCGCSDLMIRFGGHPMAAGLTLKKENLSILRKRLNDGCTLTPDDLTEKIMIDVPMPVSYITEHLVEELKCLEPCGKGNEKPVFAEKDLTILSGRILGVNRNVLKLRVRNTQNKMMDAMYFGDIEELLSWLSLKYTPQAVDDLINGCRTDMKISVLYYPDVNEYRGTRSLQIVIRDYC